jgi:hypothetical protein
MFYGGVHKFGGKVAHVEETHLLDHAYLFIKGISHISRGKVAHLEAFNTIGASREFPLIT